VENETPFQVLDSRIEPDFLACLKSLEDENWMEVEPVSPDGKVNNQDAINRDNFFKLKRTIIVSLK